MKYSTKSFIFFYVGLLTLTAANYSLYHLAGSALTIFGIGNMVLAAVNGIAMIEI